MPVLSIPDRSVRWEPTELVLSGPAEGNPFVDVDLVVSFEQGDRAIRVGGFYDGDGRYLVRFLPPESGVWRWVSTSNVTPLDGLTGDLDVRPAETQGPVHVADTYHFARADGTPFTPFGTTLYAWTHQPEQLQEQTLATLADAPFTKVRMGVFPKSIVFNENDPDRYPFLRNADGTWDTTRFDLEFFHHLEGRIRQLGELGIEADLILWHPYDRWGFADLGPDADERYVRYVVRRLAAMPNIWWSMANEYDFLRAKTLEEWDRLAGIVIEEDHVGHLISIHNGIRQFEWDKPWVTHASIQSVDRDLSTENVGVWRERWKKPVIVDEFGYEGDGEYGWCDLPGDELVRRCWEGVIRGGYVTHGETYIHPGDVVFWAKGGRLVGSSPDRIGFLRRLVEESPIGRLEAIPFEYWRTPRGGIEGEYEIFYLGRGAPRAWVHDLPEGWRVTVDVIDTWAMTIEPVDGVFEGAIRVDLPRRSYMAIRLRTAP